MFSWSKEFRFCFVCVNDVINFTHLLFCVVCTGFGVFARFRCRVTIYFQGETTIRIKSKNLKPKQKVCRCEVADECDSVITTTEDSIINETMDWFWRINHNSTDPTHLSDWDPVYNLPCVIPLRVCEQGEEICFKYNWTKKELSTANRL